VANTIEAAIRANAGLIASQILDGEPDEDAEAAEG
jgi:hypothetical protein